MGWLIGSHSRRDIVERLTQDYQGPGVTSRCLKKCFVGYQMLWGLYEITRASAEADGGPEVIRYACAYLVRRFKDGWGYKEIGRDRSCPLSYLQYLTLESPADREWVEEVRAYHARRGTGSRFEVGMTLMLKEGCSPPQVSLVGTKPLVGTYNGVRYRVRRGHIDLARTNGPVAVSASEKSVEQMYFAFGGTIGAATGANHVGA